MPYTPTTWVDGTAPAIDAANLNKVELALKAAYPVYNVLDAAYGAVGNGTTDDTTTLQAAITAAVATGGHVSSPPGKTYIVSSTLTVTGSCQIDLNGSTIKKKSTFPNVNTSSGVVFNITGTGVVVKNLTIDGNRAGGAGGGGVWSTGSGTRFENVVVKNNTWNGLMCVGGTLDAVRCEGTGNGMNGIVGFGGVLRTYSCVALSNDLVGFYFDSSASDGCRLDGRSGGNGQSGAQILGNNGHCPYFLSEADAGWGLIVGPLGNPTNWTFDYVEANNIDRGGFTGTGVEVYGARHCTFGTLVTTRSSGYGLSVSKSNDTASPSMYNVFHNVTCDHTGGTDGDPGIAINGGSSFNSFGEVTIIAHTVAINIGEGTGGNDHNTFGTVTLIGNSHGGINIDGGNYNTFDAVVSRNTSSADVHTIDSKGVLTFVGADFAAQHNTVGVLDHKDTGTDMTTVPAALVWADSAAVNNVVRDGYNRDSMVGAQDGNGGNYFYLRRPTRRTVLSTFDSGETWSNSTNNTVNGQFVEGNGGKKVTGSPGYTTSSRTVSLNLSTMADSDFFRMWVYVTNQSDMLSAPGGSGIGMQMNSASGTYYFAWQSVILKNGGQWLQIRKSPEGVSGTPSWAAITSIDFLVYSATSIATTTFDNMHIAELQWDRTPTIGQNNTAASITVGGSPFVYQNTDGVPLNVMVSGGTVSAIDYSQDNSTFYSTAQTAGIFRLDPGDYVKVTYSVTPTMSKVPTR